MSVFGVVVGDVVADFEPSFFYAVVVQVGLEGTPTSTGAGQP
jgi:hypothetical protein